MKREIKIGIALVLSTILIGCGNESESRSRETLVNTTSNLNQRREAGDVRARTEQNLLSQTRNVTAQNQLQDYNYLPKNSNYKSKSSDSGILLLGGILGLATLFGLNTGLPEKLSNRQAKMPETSSSSISSSNSHPQNEMEQDLNANQLSTNTFSLAVGKRNLEENLRNNCDTQKNFEMLDKDIHEIELAATRGCYEGKC